MTSCKTARTIGQLVCTSLLNISPRHYAEVRDRWKSIEQTLRKAPFIKIVPVIASLGCPYTCSFCIDSVVQYQPLDFDVIKEDLRFLLRKFRLPRVWWHDPNFGVRFND